MKVEVNLEDLETLIFATAVIKQIETALSGRKHDPFVKPFLKYNEAHNNLAAAMTHAKRSKETYATPWDGDLSKDEISYLQKLDAISPDYLTISIDDSYYQKVQTLMAKGCVKLGQKLSGVLWNGAVQPDLQKHPQYCVMITFRGIDKLEQALMKRAEKAGLLDESQS